MSDDQIDVGTAIFDFVQYAIEEKKYKPEDIAMALLQAYLAILVTYAELKYVPAIIGEACKYLKSVRVMKDGQIHKGNGEIH